MATPVWIGLGSNLGDRRGILESAIASIAEVPGVVVRAVSSFHETRPIGGPPGQGPFLNAAAHLETTLDPFQLLSALQRIENEAGRVRVVRWGERTLDLDILIFGTKFLDTKELKLPHPRLAFRRFVLAPLAEIAPHIVDTMTKQTIADLLANLDRRPRLLAIYGSDTPEKSAVFCRLAEKLPGIGIATNDLYLEESPIYTKRFKDLERKTKALSLNQWSSEAIRNSWIIADFSLELDTLLHRSPREMMRSPNDRGERMRDYQKGMESLQAAVQASLLETLVLIMPGQDSRQRSPGFMKSPQLWPESNDPEAIVAEILATCRGIEGV